MEINSLSQRARGVADAYLHLKVGSAAASVPYFNNKTRRARMSLGVRVGKGRPSEIKEEAEATLIKHRASAQSLTDGALKKLLVDENLGIDCSGLAYYILDAESKATGNWHLNRRLDFISARGPISKMMSYLRPAENCNVKTLASDMNSAPIELKDARPGDLISMLGSGESPDRDHILVLTEVARDGGRLVSISYIHSIAYPEDGLYGTGVREGRITVTDPDKGILDQTWSETGDESGASRLIARARSSRTEIRRLKWLN